MKSLIGPGIIALIILIGVLIILNYRDAEEEEEIIRINGWEGEKTELVLENEALKL